MSYKMLPSSPSISSLHDIYKEQPAKGPSPLKFGGSRNGNPKMSLTPLFLSIGGKVSVRDSPLCKADSSLSFSIKCRFSPPVWQAWFFCREISLSTLFKMKFRAGLLTGALASVAVAGPGLRPSEMAVQPALAYPIGFADGENANVSGECLALTEQWGIFRACQI